MTDVVFYNAFYMKLKSVKMSILMYVDLVQSNEEISQIFYLRSVIQISGSAIELSSTFYY